MQISYLFILESVIIILLGLLLALLSIRGIITKQPVIIRNLYYFGPLLLLVIPTYGYFVIQPFLYNGLFHRDLLMNIGFPIFYLIMGIIMVVILGKQIAGYLILGNNDTINEVIMKSLEELHFAYEMKLSKIVLIDMHTEINAAIISWLGTAQIRIGSVKYIKVLDEIVCKIKEIYKEGKNGINLLSLILYAIMGIAFIGGGIFLLILSTRLSN
jgi:hypothetical protein